MLQIVRVQKNDILELAKIYMKSYNAEWEKRTLKKSEEMINYRIKKKLKLKAVVDWKTAWFLFSDVKPFYYGNILIDWDLVVEPKHQKNWIWKQLFFEWMKYAYEKLDVKFWEFYTFRNSYQYERYKKLWFWESDKFVLMAGSIEKILDEYK